MKYKLLTQMAGPFSAGAIVLVNHFAPDSVTNVIASLHKCAPVPAAAVPSPFPCQPEGQYQSGSGHNIPHFTPVQHIPQPVPQHHLHPCEKPAQHSPVHELLRPHNNHSYALHINSLPIKVEACVASDTPLTGEVCFDHQANGHGALFYYN